MAPPVPNMPVSRSAMLAVCNLITSSALSTGPPHAHKVEPSAKRHAGPAWVTDVPIYTGIGDVTLTIFFADPGRGA